MTKPIPRPPRHLHAFGISLLLIVGALVFFLFGVKMESTISATGIVGSGRVVTLRAPNDAQIKYLTQSDLAAVNLEPVRPGSIVDAGIPLLVIDNGGKATGIPAPESAPRWLVLEMPAADGQRVKEGDPLVSLVPVDPQTNQILDLGVRIDVEEKQFGAVEPGQEVRLYSNMYHHRAHGVSKGTVERVEPLGTDGPNGSRRFHAWVKVTESPFAMKLGSSVRAEIVTGRKPTYQIILEH